jgi:hypothetical protein
LAILLWKLRARWASRFAHKKTAALLKVLLFFLWLASGYSRHHPHGVRFAHLLAGGSAAIPLARKNTKKYIFLKKVLYLQQRYIL